MVDSRPTRRELIALVALGFGGWGVSQVLQRTAPIGRDVSGNGTAQALVHDTAAPSEGPMDADLTVVAFNDYQCPACRRASPELEAAFTADAGVRLIYKEWPIFGVASERAARVALAADRQGIYSEVHRALMRASPDLEQSSIRSIVARSGGSWDLISRDLRDRQTDLDVQLAKTGGQAFALGLSGTPAFLIGSLLVVGALDRTEFGKAFQRARLLQK